MKALIVIILLVTASVVAVMLQNTVYHIKKTKTKIKS